MTNGQQGEPTQYLPLWRDGSLYLDAEGNRWTMSSVHAMQAIPAKRVTITPPAYEPKAGDRVATDLGYEVTILNTQLDHYDHVAVRRHLNSGDEYGSIHPERLIAP